MPRRQPEDRLLSASSADRSPSPRGPWHVVSGTGAYDGLEGDGEMKMEYEPHTEATEGRETFTGTVEP